MLEVAHDAFALRVLELEDIILDHAFVRQLQVVHLELEVLAAFSLLALINLLSFDFVVDLLVLAFLTLDPFSLFLLGILLLSFVLER